jgi:hypothetical protein
MSNNVFPNNFKGLGWPAGKYIEASNTIVQEAPTGRATTIRQMYNPIWHFELPYNFLEDKSFGNYTGRFTELRALMGFFCGQGGQWDDFLFDDPDDDFSGPALNADSSPNTTSAQLQVVNDGAGNYYSPIQRNLGGWFMEDITDLNPGRAALKVYANGVLQSLGTDYTVNGPGLTLPSSSFIGMYLHWVAGAPAAPVTAEFGFYFRVRFEEDMAKFEQMLSQIWAAGGELASGSMSIKFKTHRRPLV